MQPISGNQRPNLLTSLMNMSLVWHLPRKMHLCRSSSNATKPSRIAHFWQGASSLAPALQNNIWTSTSAPHPSVFCTFDFDMCFAPQRRALFQHLNFQKCSEPVSFLRFWLQNALCATTACIFSTSQLPKVVRTWHVLYILSWKRASRHNGVQFFWDFLPFDLLSSSPLFSDSSHLCFSSVHIVGSLTSKLPSTSSSRASQGRKFQNWNGYSL